MTDYKHWAESLILSHWNFCCCFASQSILQSLPVFISYVLTAPESHDLSTQHHAVILRAGKQENHWNAASPDHRTSGDNWRGRDFRGLFWLSPAMRGTGPEPDTAWPVCPTEDSRGHKAWTLQEHWGSSHQKRKRELLVWGNQGTAPSASCDKPLKTNATMSDQLEGTQIKRAGGKFSTALAHIIDGWWMD